MASIKRFPGREGKASSLDSLFSMRPQTDRVSRDAGDRHKNFGTAGLDAADSREKNLSWLVDIIILAVIALVLAAVYFHVIRPVIRNYDDIWDEKTMVCVIELPGLDPSQVEYERDGTLSVKGREIYASAYAESDCIGTVKDCSAAVSAREDGTRTVTLTLTVEADTRFRNGEGYFAGETRLLCGETRTFRLWGLSAEGSILTMREKEE